ncbi:MAG TPA: 50S ribosomal protein L32e [Candidatus Eisenbacteria bacterium]|nr:50S ribosomal protein L32e [Candidatus Eisenbacteria bacterium]
MTEKTGKITSEKALKVRRRVKKNKPKFVRPESWRYVRLKKNWRNPRGLDHKVRLMYKGWPPAAGSGYGGPKVSRHLHPSGYMEVLIYNVEQLAKVDSSTQAVRIAHTVGKRKKTRILAEARKKKIVVLNLREVKEPAEEKKEETTKETGKEAEKEETAEAEKKQQETPKTSKRRAAKR